MRLFFDSPLARHFSHGVSLGVFVSTARRFAARWLLLHRFAPCLGELFFLLRLLFFSFLLAFYSGFQFLFGFGLHFSLRLALGLAFGHYLSQPILFSSHNAGQFLCAACLLLCVLFTLSLSLGHVLGSFSPDLGNFLGKKRLFRRLILALGFHQLFFAALFRRARLGRGCL